MTWSSRVKDSQDRRFCVVSASIGRVSRVGAALSFKVILLEYLAASSTACHLSELCSLRQAKVHMREAPARALLRYGFHLLLERDSASVLGWRCYV